MSLSAGPSWGIRLNKGSDAAQHRDDDAQHGGPVAIDDLINRVARLEQDVAAAAPVHLDRGLPVDHRGHDLPRVRTSRGTGFWGPPFRIFAPSEITLITLHTPPDHSAP